MKSVLIKYSGFLRDLWGSS